MLSGTDIYTRSADTSLPVEQESKPLGAKIRHGLSPMRIIHVVDSMEVGGAEVLIALLCRSQRSEGHLPTVYCLFDGGTLAKQLEAEGIPVRVFGLVDGVSAQFRLLRNLYRIFAETQPDVVHCHNIMPTILAAPAARLAGVPGIYSTRHGLAIPYFVPAEVKGIADSAGAFYRFRLAATCCDRVIAVCEMARQNLQSGPGAFLSRVTTIRNGAAAQPVSPKPDPAIQKQGFTLVHVARLNWKKNQATLLRAFSLALQHIPDLFLWVIGDGPEAENLQTLTKELGIESRVRFTGERADVGDWLAQADLFVLSSLTEGLPMSLVEAMAAGLPFLVTNVGGMPEIAELSQAGMVVESNRSEALGDGIVQLAKRRTELKEMGRRARECYETHFTPTLMLAGYAQLYASRRRIRLNKGLRVLHITLTFAQGGRRNAILSLTHGLREIGVVNDICSLEELGCQPEDLVPHSDRIEPLRRNRLFDWKVLTRLRKLCREEKIDIVHTHDAASQITSAIACFGMPHIRQVMTFHRTLPFESSTFQRRLRNAIASTQCGAIITASRERREHFIAENMISSRKVLQIPLGIDLRKFRPNAAVRESVRKELGIDPGVILLGSIGHFGEEKGIDIAIRGFQALSNRQLQRQVALVVFGSGSRKRELEELAAQGGPGPIYFAGFREDIHRYMAGLDMLLHAPRMEAFGLVVIEAMATGIPVVASRVGGLPELLENGTTGFLAEPERPESFAAALELLVNDPALLELMGKEARLVAVANYGSDLFAHRHLQLYENLMANRPFRPLQS